MAQYLELIVDLLKEINRANNTKTERVKELLDYLKVSVNKFIFNKEQKIFFKKYLEILTKITSKQITTAIETFEKIHPSVNNLAEHVNEHGNNKFTKNISQKYFENLSILTKISDELNLFHVQTEEDLSSFDTIRPEDFTTVTTKVLDVLTRLNNNLSNALIPFNTDLRDVIKYCKEIENEKNQENLSILKNQLDIFYNLLEQDNHTISNLNILLSELTTEEDLKLIKSIEKIIIEQSENTLYHIKEIEENTNSEENSTQLSKAEFAKISIEIEEIIGIIEEIKQFLANTTNTIDSSNPEITELIFLHKNLYIKNSSINIEINKLDNNNNTYDIESKIQFLNDNFNTIKDIIDDLQEILTSKINQELINLKIDSTIESNIREIVSLQISDEVLHKTILDWEENLNTFDNEDLITFPTEQNEEIDNDVDNDFEDLFIEEDLDNIYDKNTSMDSNQTDSNKKDNDTNLDKRIENMTNKKDTLNSMEKFISKLENQSTNNNGEISNILQDEIKKIKNFLNTKKSEFFEISKGKDAQVSLIQAYIDELKTIFENSNNTLSENITEKFEQVETDLEKYQLYNEEKFDRVMEQLEKFKYPTSQITTENEAGLVNSASEIEGLKKLITDLTNSYTTISNDSSNNSEIPTFITKKLQDIAINLDDLKDTLESNMQLGFTNNAEILEEKTSTLLNLVQELRHTNTNNLELFERLTVTDNKLMDFQQELELINTDVIENFNNKAEQLLLELSPIKEVVKTLTQQLPTEVQDENVKEHLSILHDSVQTDLVNCTKYSKSTFDKLEEIYTQIINNITTSEKTLRDYLLSDIDSVIIKIDNLRDEVESRLNKIVPPNAEQLENLNLFVKDILEFKKSQSELLTEISEDIKTSITTVTTEQHEELKSLLTVAINNNEIIDTLKELKKYFISKVPDLKNMQTSETDYEDFGTNQYEEIFEEDSNNTVVSEIKEDFNKFSDLINNLSGENTEIKEVLNQIREKINTIKVVKREELENNLSEIDLAEETAEISDRTDFDFYDTDIDSDNDSLPSENIITTSENTNFDFIKAFDLLSQDIKNIKEDIEQVLPKEVHLKDIPIKSLDKNNLLMNLNNKIELISKTLNKDWLEEIKKYINNEEIQSMLESINSKLDILTLTDNTELFEEIKNKLSNLNGGEIDTNTTSEIQKKIDLLNNKIDILAADENSGYLDDIQDIRDALFDVDEKVSSKIDTLDQKIDIIATSDNTDSIEDIKYTLYDVDEKISSKIDTLDQKIDIIATSDNTDSLEDIKNTLYNVEEQVNNIKPVQNTIENLSKSDVQMTSMLETLNHKIDIIAGSKEETNSEQGIEDVKHLILAQMDYIERLEHNHKTEAFKKCLKELTLEVNNINLDSKSNTKNIQKTLKDMKESIMAAVVTIFEQVSFVEETEDIKDFVEERTEVINKNLVEVTKQLKQITNANDSVDYTYSMQDIESDLAKIRIAINEYQSNEQENKTSEFANISDTLERITSSVEELQNSMTQDEVRDLKNDILNLQTQTQKLLISSDESYNALNNGLEGFEKIITNQLSNKVDNVTKMLEQSSNSDKVMRQALIYMGEWIDSASESMNKISTNSEELTDIKTTIEDLKKTLPEHTGILNSIEEKFDEQQERLAYFEKQISKIGSLENRFEEQQERIDRLELSLEKILSAVENLDDTKVTRKIEKIDKQMEKLSTNIEKLASYVD